MATDEQALLRAVLERPDDDIPRLVYADWLEENGRTDWAGFIRAQCAGERPRVSARQFRQWFTALPWLDGLLSLSVGRGAVRARPRYVATGTPPNAPLVVVHRGFVNSLTTTTSEFLRLAPILFRRHPITEVVITDAVARLSSSSPDAPTYYVGGETRFPARYWHRLNNHPTREAALDALGAVCVDYGRELAELPPLRVPATSR